jgi:hypothetical protein
MKDRRFIMKTKQLTESQNSKVSSRINSLAQALAIGGLAIGVAASMPAAPARAVLLNSGNLAFSDGTTDFFTSTGQTSYTLDFNPFGAAFISSATGSFGSTFSPGATPTVTSSTGIFNQESGDIFSLASPLSFNFPVNGVNISIDPGSTFSRTFNNVNAGVGFSNANVTGTVTNADGTVNLQALSFTFNDNPNPGGGSYSITLSPTNPLTQVPEPFTVIGTIVGGTAAFRMRKKLSKSA